MAAEIQPHQHLTGPFAKGLPVRGGAEAVDAAKAALYKSANGGGRNPAAAVSLSGAVAQACLLPPAWQSQGASNNTPASIMRLKVRHAEARPLSGRSPKDI
jgi:hypothetical protein